MPRPLRIHVPGAFYHVTLRGNHRQNIFFSAADRQLFDDITAEVITRFSARVHAYCWMTNHVHILIQVGDAPLGRLMLRVAGRYARSVQSKLRTTGHLFEKRYHPVLVDADEYLLALVRYIHLNPVRARMIQHPTDYPWSSHRTYIGAVTKSWVTTDFALGMFHTERERAIAAYQRFIDAGVASPSVSPLIERNPSDARILGSDEFVGKLLGDAWRPGSQKTLSHLIAEACLQFSVSEQALHSPCTQRHITKARAWIAHQAIVLRIASLSQVARHFNRTEGALRQSVKLHFNYP
ncbi:MAG: REP-associated tyrosine transposase [Steroidobacter sp.]